MVKIILNRVCKSCGGKIKCKNPKFCSSQCSSDYAYKSYIKRWKRGLENGRRGELMISQHIRRYLFEKYDNKCSRCGWAKINKYTNKIPLEVEHIDGNYRNCAESNLTLICPNCHSLTSTYKGLNVGHGRSSRDK